MSTKIKTKILMTTDTVGGVWTYSMDLIRALAPYGVEVHLVTLGGAPNAHQQKDLQELENLVLYPSSYKLEWMEDPWEELEVVGNWLMELKVQVQPDLIHLNNLVFADLPWERPVVQVVHACVLSWWKAVKGEEAPAVWQTYTQRVRQSLHAADVVVAPTRVMLEEARSLYGFSKEIRVIYNGRDSNRFRFGYKKPFLFSTGRLWDEAKNIALLAQIAPDLPWPVYIAGESINPATGQEVTIENVRFLGHLSQKEIRSWLSKASIFVQPSRYEPFGLAVLEAAMSGCALVVGNTKSLKEVWDNAAHYVDPNDAEGLKAILQKLIDNEWDCNIMACRAAKQSYAYTAKMMTYEYVQLYRDLLEKYHTGEVGQELVK